MKSLFPKSGQVLPQFGGFEAIFVVLDKISDFSKVHLYILSYSKQLSQSHSFNANICWENDPPCAEIFEKKKKIGLLFGLACRGGRFSKLIFALKLWDRGGHFEYKKGRHGVNKFL